MLADGYDGPALAAATSLGLMVLRTVVAEGAPAGSFTLSADGATGDALPASDPTDDDVALILHTSGTTSRPKIVPLLQSNVAASAHNIAASLKLSSDDRCLNVMPLFHIHGLLAAVSASLSVGASIWCAPGFDALRFFGWMRDARPTWYTAVPTMHQAILSRAGRNADVIEEVPLRFLRSSSASLPAQVMEALRETFVANASHELKTPLASIIGFIETLRGAARDDAQARDRFLTIMESETLNHASKGFVADSLIKRWGTEEEKAALLAAEEAAEAEADAVP